MPSVVQIWIGVGSFKYKLYNAVASREQVSGSSQVTKGRGAGRVVILNSKNEEFKADFDFGNTKIGSFKPYVTDDKNHLPVRLDMFLSFGSAKAYLTGFKGLRNPMESKVE